MGADTGWQADKSFYIGRTMYTYFNTIKILCHGFKIEPQGTSFTLEKRLIEETYNLKHIGKILIVIIDDAHLMEMQNLRKLRLLFEKFPQKVKSYIGGAALPDTEHLPYCQ